MHAIFYQTLKSRAQKSHIIFLTQMSEEPHADPSNNNDERKKTRRTRKDEDGRNYQCGCGKSYLSYPALYTHIKTKHQGKAPKEGEVSVARPEPEQENEQKDPLNTMKEHINRELARNPSFQQKPQNILSEQDKALVRHLQQTWETEKDLFLADPSTNNPAATIDVIFGKFLWEMQSKVKQAGYKYVCKFATSFHKTISQQKNDRDYCKKNTGTDLPNFFNDLIVKTVLPTIQIKQEGQSAFESAFACKNLFFFGGWIFEQRFTNFSVKFNSN